MNQSELDDIKDTIKQSKEKTNAISRVMGEGRVVEDHTNTIYDLLESLTEEIEDLSRRISRIEGSSEK